MKNIYFYNFKYFNFVFYFNLIKYFNLVFYFNLFSSNVLKFNLVLMNINVKFVKKNFSKNYIFNYFNLFFFKVLDEHSNFNKFSNLNFVNYKNLINILYNFNISKLNYLIFDNNKYLHNLYLNMYSLRKLLIYQNYFYTDPKYFTHKNFIYFYNQFLIDNKIYLVIIFNISYILNFSHVLENLNIILFTFTGRFCFINNNYNIHKKINFFNLYLYILLFNQIWIFSVNFHAFSNKLLYINYLNNFKL